MIKYTNNIYPGYEKLETVFHLDSKFEKVAYEMADATKEFIETLKPTKESGYWAVNAMGAEETYGSNTRGDAFPRVELINHHKTFQTNPAKFYVSHQNKDPQRSLGEVVFSHFNPETDRVELVKRADWALVDKYAPDWLRTKLKMNQPFNTSMGCLNAKTPISIKNGYKFIEDIQVGDIVKTHTGNYKKVKGLFSKYFKEGIYNIKVQSFGKAFKVTYEHPFYCINKEQVCEYGIPKFTNLDEKELKPDWIKTQDLKVGDYLAYTFNNDIEDDPETSVEFARLLGYYLSEGQYCFDKRNNNSGICFHLHRDELNYIEEISNIVKNLYNYHTKCLEYPDISKGLRVYIHNKEIAEKLAEYGGKGAKTKKLSDKVLTWDPKLQLELLGAFINGDGCLYNNTIYFEIANYELSMQLCEIAARNGITWTIQEIKHKANEKSVCKSGTESICWQVRFPKKYNYKFQDVTDKCGTIEDKNYPDRKFFWKNYIFSPISKIEFDDEWKGMIYNFEVEEDESYIANNIVVHNCKVARDECTYCGKHNKTMADYCVHLKTQMHQFLDGIKVAARNIQPNFFDNSGVQRGADPIARSITKVAGLNDELTITRDEELNLGKKYFTVPDLPKATHFINKKTVEKVASLVGTLSKESLDYLSDTPVSEILGTAKAVGCEFLPSEYQYLILKGLEQHKLAEYYYDNNIVFEIPDTTSTKQITLNYSNDALEKFACYIPLKSFYKPFVLYREFTKTATESPVKLKIERNEILDMIGESYSNYTSSHIEKTALDLGALLMNLFVMLPDIIKQQELHAKDENTATVGLQRVVNSTAKSSQIPLLPGLPNPVYPFMKSASFMDGAKNILKNTKRVAPLGLGIGSTLLMAGTDAKREAEGNEKAGKGPFGFARKHPFMTAAGITGLGYAGLKKISSEDYLNDYKSFLKELSNKEFFKVAEEMPNELFFELILN